MPDAVTVHADSLGRSLDGRHGQRHGLLEERARRHFGVVRAGGARAQSTDRLFSLALRSLSPRSCIYRQRPPCGTRYLTRHSGARYRRHTTSTNLTRWTVYTPLHSSLVPYGFLRRPPLLLPVPRLVTDC